MSSIGKRLKGVEERKAFRRFAETERQFKDRTADELEFFAIHGYFPETANGELPKGRDFCIAGIRTIVTKERAET